MSVERVAHGVDQLIPRERFAQTRDTFACSLRPHNIVVVARAHHHRGYYITVRAQPPQKLEPAHAGQALIENQATWRGAALQEIFGAGIGDRRVTGGSEEGDERLAKAGIVVHDGNEGWDCAHGWSAVY
jgi:hypothetical protein